MQSYDTKTMTYDSILTQEQKENIINDYVNNHLTMKEVGKKYSIRSYSYLCKLLKGYSRTSSEAAKLARQRMV